MDFEGAVALLSQAHRDEVQRLRQTITDLESRVLLDARVQKNCGPNASPIDASPCGSDKTDMAILPRPEGHQGEIYYDIQYSFNDVTSELDVVADAHPEISNSILDKDLNMWQGELPGSHAAVGRWRTLSEHVIDVKLSGGSNSFLERGGRRWLLLSHRYIMYREERAMTRAIRPAVPKFELMTVWTRRKPSVSRATDELKVTSVESHIGDVIVGRGLLRHLTIHPHSLIVFIWSLLVAMVVMYDVFVIPLDLCNLFTPPTILIFFYSIFWLSDLIVSCGTGIERDDYVIDMRVSTIVRAYARSWMIPDLLLIFVDMLILVLELLANVDADGSGFFRTLRANRMIRLVRLVRLFRMRRLSNAWQAFFSSSSVAYLIMVGRIFEHSVGVCIVNHYIACMWYGLGTWNLDTDEPTWLNILEYRNYSSAASYAYSLHWALTQVSPSSQNIAPQNPYERTYALCVALFSLLSFSWFVSQVTAALNQLLKAKQGRERQEMLLRGFCRRKGVSTKIAGRIMKFFKRNYDNITAHSTEGNIEFLAELPESMRLHLHAEIYLPILTTHMFFDEYFNNATRDTVLKICHTAMFETRISPCQDVFIPRTEARHVYILRQGKMLYTVDNRENEVPEDGMISEMSFWAKWEHVGTLTASIESICELVSIHLGTFHSIFAYEDGAVHETFRLLAIFAVEQMEIAASKDRHFTDFPLSDSTKLEIIKKTDDFTALRRNMERDSDRRTITSSEALNFAPRPFGWSVAAGRNDHGLQSSVQNHWTRTLKKSIMPFPRKTETKGAFFDGGSFKLF